MKKILTIILATFILFSSCTNSNKRDISWTDIDKVIENRGKLKTGDILVVKKYPDIYSLWGHTGIYLEDYDYVGEYPQIGHGFFYVPSEIWASELPNRKVTVLRLKNINEKFREDLKKEIDENKYKDYKIVLDKNSNKAYYCSQWVWKMFQLTASKHGQSLDLDSNGGVLVMPYDFLDSEYLDIIDMNI